MITIEKISDPVEWEKIVSKSEQYSLFCSSKFLSGFSCPYELFIIKDNQNIKMAALVFLKSKNLEKHYMQDFNYNQGFYFFDKDLIERKRNHERNKLLTFFLEFITKKSNEFRFSLHYSLKDIRAFQWFEYPKKPFELNIVYSSVVDLKKFKNFEEFLKSTRYERRRELKNFQETNFKIAQTKDVEKFINFYKILIPQVGKPLYDTHLKVIRNSSKNLFSRINFLLDEDKIIAATLFYFHKNSSYYAFSASDPKYKKKFSSTVPLILEQIKYALKNKIKNVDFLGVNSPNRGDFKESFGGDLISFNEIVYKKK